MIEVRLFATFREGREKILFLDAGEFKKAGDVLEHLNIPYEQVDISDQWPSFQIYRQHKGG